MKKVLICGAAGFLGHHLEYRLKNDGRFVVSAARHAPPFRKSVADEFHIIDLREPKDVFTLMGRYAFDEVYQMAGEVGGLTYIGDMRNDANILTNSVKINLAVLDAAVRARPGKIFFASSQCVYPTLGLDPFAQERIALNACREQDASFDTFAFGQEKLFSEQLYAAYDGSVAIARFGNTYGPYSTWNGPRAKAPAALCRKVAKLFPGQDTEIIGSGTQTRSFTYVDDAVEGMIRLMASDYGGPVNIASSEMVTIKELAEAVCRAAGKPCYIKSVPGPIGVRGRNSDNTLCREILGWEPTIPLSEGLAQLYPWVAKELALTNTVA